MLRFYEWCLGGGLRCRWGAFPVKESTVGLGVGGCLLRFAFLLSRV